MKKVLILAVLAVLLAAPVLATEVRHVEFTPFYGVYGSGIWMWDGAGWHHITESVPDVIAASDGQLIAGFPNDGTWLYKRGQWRQISTDNPSMLLGR